MTTLAELRAAEAAASQKVANAQAYLDAVDKKHHEAHRAARDSPLKDLKKAKYAHAKACVALIHAERLEEPVTSKPAANPPAATSPAPITDRLAAAAAVNGDKKQWFDDK